MKKNYPVSNTEKTFDDTKNLLSTTDKKGVITYANADFISMSGFTLDELVDKNHNVVRHPDMPTGAFDDLWKTVKAGNSWMGIVKNRCKNGDHYWVDAYVTPMIHNGKIDEYQSVRSKPSREQIKRAESLYKQLSAGKTPWQWQFSSISLNSKLTVAMATIYLSVFTLLYILGEINLGVAVIGCGFGALFSAVSNFILTRPMAAAVDKAKGIYQNRIAQWVYTGTHDESGQLLLAIKMLESGSTSILGRIRDSAEQLTTQGALLVKTATTTNEKITEQHSEIDKVATAIDEMAVSIQEVARNAQSTANSAEEANEKAKQGKIIVEETTCAMKSLATDMGVSSGFVQKLADDSNNINSVVDAIRGIAEQTNLLALNAAIEAARAGEQGRGFAIVADEVRTLAKRTQDSTSEIQTMIERLQTASDVAVKSMSDSRAKADRGTEKAATTVVALDAITSGVEAIDSMVAQIASAVHQQSAVSEDISRSVATITALAESTVEGVMQSEKAGHLLNNQAHRLVNLAVQFRIQKHGNMRLS